MKNEEVTMYDDWSIWEALKMAKLKGNELIVYSHFARATARQLSLPLTSTSRTLMNKHEIIKIVDVSHNGKGTSGLTQTQVRYAMKKLIAKGMVEIQNQGERPEYYVSVCDLKMREVNKLIKRSEESREKFGSLEEAKVKMKARIEKAVRKLNSNKHKISKCKTHLELTDFDRPTREFLMFRD